MSRHARVQQGLRCALSLSLSGLGGVFGMTGMEKGRVVLLRNHAVVATGHTPHSSHFF